jgi:hypothetical protein
MPAATTLRKVRHVCFSAQADAVTGVFVTAIGVDVCRHVGGRRDHLLLASIPLLLGAHQLIEVFVWWGLQGHVATSVGRFAMWVYLIIAFVVLPVLVPLAVLVVEPTAERRRRMVPFVALGAIVAVLLAWGLTRGPVTVSIEPWHLAYKADLSHGIATTGLYIVAICGALLLSGFRHIALYGLGNLVVVVVLAALTIGGFASLWCGYAAASAGAIALHTRYAAATGRRPLLP